MTEQVRKIPRTLPGIPQADPVEGRVQDYLNTRYLRETAEAEETAKKVALMSWLETSGQEDGDHRIVSITPYPLGNKMIRGLKRERRVSQQFDADAALDLVKEKGLEAECVRTVTYQELDEGAVLGANYEGKISDEEIQALYSNKESFALVLVKDE